MRGSAVGVVFTLLLPVVFPSGGPSGDAGPAPLDLFGGETAWRPRALVVEVYYHALRPDEYVVIANTDGASPLNLSGWTVSDGEGTLRFPARASSSSTVVIAQNSTAYFEDTLRLADFRYGDGNATPMLSSGTFQLNNEGDEVVLRDASGAVVDVFAYGSSPYSGEGWAGPTALPVPQGFVASRAHDGTWQDTNGSADWDLVRIRSLGQSRFPGATFRSASTEIRAFATPDAMAWPLTDLLNGTAASVDASLYTLTSPALAAALRAAASRGVRVRLLLEGSPVGGIEADEWALVQGLAAAGADVRFMVDDTGRDVQERYRYLHAKYAVLDGRWVLVSTENWGDSAFPVRPRTGSRGWGIALEHPPLAAYFASVFEEDFDARRRDIVPASEFPVRPVPARPDPAAPRNPRFPVLRSVESDLVVTPVLGPDTSLATLEAIRAAAARIHIELFYAHAAWGPFPNLFLEEVVAAARRGVSVRILLDASPYNTDGTDPIDNDDVVVRLNAIAAEESLDLVAKLADLGAHGLTRVHAKGFVVDRRWTLISSMNWNRNSATANREVGVLVESPSVAAYFDDVFAWDWKDDVTPPTADAGPDRDVEPGTPVTFNGLGSTDDVGVVNWSWDFDGDGRFDAWGPEATAVFPEPGILVVRLRVADAANNTADDTATVVVRRGPDPTPVPWWPLAPVVALLGSVLWFARARRRRQRLSKPP